MLVLSRKPLESVVVGGVAGIERLLKVTVLEIKHGSVRLGFETADDVPIHRWEIWERIQNGELPAKASVSLDQSVLS
ncbi:MAG: hypothetical protein FD138_4007 [Planctomycetota bacterium]|nr:MAG: hypothetical protein FD138_4007 [Planctomycetota bacterium]